MVEKYDPFSDFNASDYDENQEEEEQYNLPAEYHKIFNNQDVTRYDRFRILMEDGSTRMCTILPEGECLVRRGMTNEVLTEEFGRVRAERIILD